jgi:8-oxo-dGTP diphosphatase
VRVTAGGFLYENDRVLLARRHRDRSYYPGVWDIVGGHCRPAETREQTLCREFQEELGVVPVRYREIGVFPELDAEKHGPGEHHVFVVTEWTGSPRNVRPDEHEELGWFSKAQLHEIDLAFPEFAWVLEGIFDNP